MPQMNKGGKFVFGKSLVREDGSLRLPPQAVREYDITAEGRLYLFTGSRSTGGFCVTRKGLLEPSALGGILRDLPKLRGYTAAEGTFLRYKGRAYAWLPVDADGIVKLRMETLDFLGLSPGMELLSIRSSNIAFTMGAKGPLIARAAGAPGELEVY